MLEGLAVGLMLLGVVLLVVAAVGVLRLPDALSRQHAATKAATLALAVLLAGVALRGGSLEWMLRALAVFAVLLVTLPVASHLLARAALKEGAGRTPQAGGRKAGRPGE